MRFQGISFSTSTRRLRCLQCRQGSQFVEQVKRQLCQLITLERPERQQRVEAIKDSELDCRLAPMPLSHSLFFKKIHISMRAGRRKLLGSECRCFKALVFKGGIKKSNLECQQMMLRKHSGWLHTNLGRAHCLCIHI